MIKTLKNLINQFKIKRIKGDYFNLLKERELKAVFSNVPLDAFDNALEIGAGNGYFATLYKKHAKKILCTELSDVIFQAVPTQGITYRQMDAERLIENNCTPERYDLIVANNVLEHIPEIDKTLLDLRKLLADDGVFVIYLPNRLWKFLHIFLYFPERVATLIDSRDFSLRNIKNVFTVDTNGNNLNLKEKNHFTLKNIFIPISPHGANLSHLVEFYKFGKAYWKKKFRNNGFRVVKVKGTTFSTGYMFGYVSFQKVMEKMRIFTETAYVLTKDNAISLEKAGYFNSNRKECLMKKNIGYKLWKHLNKKYGNTHITPPPPYPFKRKSIQKIRYFSIMKLYTKEKEFLISVKLKNILIYELMEQIIKSYLINSMIFLPVK